MPDRGSVPGDRAVFGQALAQIGSCRHQNGRGQRIDLHAHAVPEVEPARLA